MIFLVAACSKAPPQPQAVLEEVPAPAQEQAPIPVVAAVAPPPLVKATIVAVGDVLPHRRVKATAAHLGWEHVFGDSVALVRGADFAFANLESPIAPKVNKRVHGEVFNAPASLAKGLAESGFDLVSFANNHAYDQGPAGILETLEHLADNKVLAVGAAATCAGAREPVLYEKDGMKIAFLATADLTNIDGRDGQDNPCVFYAGDLCTGECGPDRDAIHFRPDLRRLKEAVSTAQEQADFVVLSFHWGNEYRTTPLKEYPLLAAELIGAGVDVILGHHPHVVQPAQALTANGRTGIVVYSLGNYVSDMASRYPTRGNANTRDSGLLELTFVKQGAHKEVNASFHAFWTANNKLKGEGDATADIHLQALSAVAPELADARRAHLAPMVKPPIVSALGEAQPSSEH